MKRKITPVLIGIFAKNNLSANEFIDKEYKGNPPPFVRKNPVMTSVLTPSNQFFVQSRHLAFSGVFSFSQATKT